MLKLKLQYLGHLMWRTDSLEKTLKLVHPKGDQSWVFIGWTDVEAETPILWPPHTKSWLIGKYPMLGRTGGRRRRGRQRIRWLDGIINSLDVGLGRLRELVMDSEVWCAMIQRVGHDWATELNWPDDNQQHYLTIFWCTWLSSYINRILHINIYQFTFFFFLVCTNSYPYQPSV